MHIGIQHGHEEVVRVLLRRGDLNVNSKNSFGQTAFDLAKDQKIIELLLSFGAVSGIKNN